MMHHSHNLKNDILIYSHRLYQKNMVAANDGNISAMTEDGSYWFTPAGMCKGDLTPQDLVKIDRNAKQIGGHRKVTSEYKMHLAVYSVRKDIRAIVHAHPVYATAFATARIGMESCVLPEIIITLGKIPLAPYDAPSTDELADSVSRIMAHHDVCLMANHGIVAAGRSVAEAYYHVERVEHYAHILFTAKLLGGEKTLDMSSVERLREIQEVHGNNEHAIPECVVKEKKTESVDHNCSADCFKQNASLQMNEKLTSIINEVIHQQLKSKGK